MARGDAVDAQPRRDRWVNQDLIVKLGNEGVKAADVVRAHVEAGHGTVAVSTVYSTWHRHGVKPREARHDDMVPWVLRDGAYAAYPAQMLRADAREKAGEENSDQIQLKLDRFRAAREREGTVVHYDPEDPRGRGGWMYVDRRPGIDEGLIRSPWFTDRGERILHPRGLRAGATPPWERDPDQEPSNRVIDLRDRARTRA